ncbi:hypothetical protein LCGC14_1086930 [marine sediment metagenome]|uniref:Uncharacterized protein n=1 Tax=marine sediment metagenome TaxID=412755 RepID=A0A0F9PWS6_9ZZZZ
MGRPIQKASTSQSTVIRILDSTTFLPETAVEYNTAGIDLWYRREQETITAIVEAALAALDTAWSAGGIEHISDGYYRLDLPDAAVAAGAGKNSVQIGGTVTGMIVIGNEHALVDYDPYDTIRMGMTALPAAAANAAGGLPVSAAGGLALDTKLANTNEITAARMGALTDWINAGRLDAILDTIATDAARLTAARAQVLDDWINGGRLDLLIDAIKAKTDNLPADPADDSDIDTQLAAIAAYIDTEIAAIKTVVDAIVLDTGTDGVILKAAGLNADAVDKIIDEVIEGTLTFRQLLRIALAALAGKTTGGGTTTVNFRNIADNLNRIIATVDADGNRSAITLDGT